MSHQVISLGARIQSTRISVANIGEGERRRESDGRVGASIEWDGEELNGRVSQSDRTNEAEWCLPVHFEQALTAWTSSKYYPRLFQAVPSKVQPALANNASKMDRLVLDMVWDGKRAETR